VTHTRVKNQGQRSVGSKDRVKTNGQTDTTEFTAFLADAVGKN